MENTAIVWPVLPSLPINQTRGSTTVQYVFVGQGARGWGELMLEACILPNELAIKAIKPLSNTKVNQSVCSGIRWTFPCMGFCFFFYFGFKRTVACNMRSEEHLIKKEWWLSSNISRKVLRVEKWLQLYLQSLARRNIRVCKGYILRSDKTHLHCLCTDGRIGNSLYLVFTKCFSFAGVAEY